MIVKLEEFDLKSSSEVGTIAGSAESTVVPTKTVPILHVINGEHFSGAERVQDLLAMALPGFGYEADFACLKGDEFPRVRKSESRLFELDMRSRLDFRAVGKLIRICREGKYKILHAHTPRTLMIARLAAWRLKIPLVYHVHSPVGRDSDKGFSNRLNTMVETFSLRGVDRMICVSGSLKNYMRQLGHAEERLTTVANGVCIVDKLPERTAPGNGWTIGAMALFRPRKGTEVLLEALAILKEKKVPVRLRAVGPFETTNYQASVMAHVDRLGIADMIEWVGFQSDVNAQLRQMDVFVLPSLFGEGLPMVVLEAMANAVPVVASDVEGIPEAVRDGVDGLIFQPGDAIDLATKLGSLVGNDVKWRSMSQNSLQRQRSELSDINMARGVASVYDELLAKR